MPIITMLWFQFPHSLPGHPEKTAPQKSPPVALRFEAFLRSPSPSHAASERDKSSSSDSDTSNPQPRSRRFREVQRWVGWGPWWWVRTSRTSKNSLEFGYDVNRLCSFYVKIYLTEWHPNRLQLQKLHPNYMFYACYRYESMADFLLNGLILYCYILGCSPSKSRKWRFVPRIIRILTKNEPKKSSEKVRIWNSWREIPNCIYIF